MDCSKQQIPRYLQGGKPDFEYRRERKEYLWWKEHVKGNVYADDHD